MYIEPCCCERQLPQVLRSGVPFFQTSGDVSFDKLLKSCASLAGMTLDMLLVVPAVDVPMLSVLCHYYHRGWLTGLSLLTHDDQRSLVSANLPEALSVTYAFDPALHDALFALTGTAEKPSPDAPNATVIINGPLSSTPTPGITNYSCYFGRNEEHINSLIKPYLSDLTVKGRAQQDVPDMSSENAIEDGPSDIVDIEREGSDVSSVDIAADDMVAVSPEPPAVKTSSSVRKAKTAK